MKKIVGLFGFLGLLFGTIKCQKVDAIVDQEGPKVVELSEEGKKNGKTN